MKQRVQIISESLHSIQASVDILREIACDLTDCKILTDQLTKLIDGLELYRRGVSRYEAEEPRRLKAPQPPRRREAKPELNYDLLPSPVHEIADHADPLSHDGFPSDLPRDPYGRLEDPPCIACGAPESVCECETPAEGDSTCEPPHAGMEPLNGSERVFDRGAYLDWKGLMCCCETEPEPFAVDGQREPDYHCPKCSRMCLGNHLEDEEVWAAERAAGWDPNP